MVALTVLFLYLLLYHFQYYEITVREFRNQFKSMYEIWFVPFPNDILSSPCNSSHRAKSSLFHFVSRSATVLDLCRWPDSLAYMGPGTELAQKPAATLFITSLSYCSFFIRCFSPNVQA